MAGGKSYCYRTKSPETIDEVRNLKIVKLCLTMSNMVGTIIMTRGRAGLVAKGHDPWTPKEIVNGKQFSPGFDSPHNCLRLVSLEAEPQARILVQLLH